MEFRNITSKSTLYSSKTSNQLHTYFGPGFADREIPTFLE